jgi:predicted GTPase
VKIDMRKVIILGAAGRDFHNFLTYYKENLNYQVVAFTATQIPGIENRKFPSELSGKNYPNGIPIYPEERLPHLVKELEANEVVFSYSDISHLDLMHKASIALASGASFVLLGPKDTMLVSRKPVIAVCAVRTGAGKSPTVRKISLILREMGYKVAIIRHPMPYGDLAKEAVQKFSSFEDLKNQKSTIEEREEYEAHIANGFSVYAGVDYAKILRLAEETADIVIFEGGNNDFSFIKPDLLFVVADALRPGHELTYHPGETNVRMADYVIIDKIDAAPKENKDHVIANVRELNSKAKIILANLTDTVEKPELIKGKKVLCIEDGPTLTHGGLSTGAAFKVAEKFGAKEIVDPRKYAVGSLKDVFSRFTHLGKVLPAMGYSDDQMKELEQTINDVDCDLVVIGTPVDLGRFLQIAKPSLRVKYEIEEIGDLTIRKALEEFGRGIPVLKLS